jgi:hypothetical protein
MSFILDALVRQGASPFHGPAKPASRALAPRRAAVAGIVLVLIAGLSGAGLYATRARRAVVNATAAPAPSREPVHMAAIEVPTMAPRPMRHASEPAASAVSAAGANRAATSQHQVPRFSPPTSLSQALPVPSPRGPGGAFVAAWAAPASSPRVEGAEAPRTALIADLKPVSVLAPEIRAMLAQTKVQVLFYAPQARSRFVMIDGRQLREGDELLAGLRLQEITDTGMVLRHKDVLVLLPTQEGR